MKFSFGGRTAVTEFLQPTPTDVMMDEWGMCGARTRPLNLYMFGSIEQSDSKNMEFFHCPSDTGYPDSAWVRDAPRSLADIPCYDVVGNSYRNNSAGLIWTGGTSHIGGFQVSPMGHRLSTLPNPGRLAVIMEPMFYNFSRQNAAINPDLLPIAGWHKKVMTDNVLYVDASARPTRVNELSTFDPTLLGKMGYTPNFPWNWFLRRGRTWQTDSYPTPGAFIAAKSPNGTRIPHNQLQTWTGWPFSNYQDNMR